MRTRRHRGSTVPLRANGADVPAVAVGDLSKQFGPITAVQGVSLEIPPGEIFAFLGPNGAGKSTTVRMLCTLTRPTGGWARVGGYDVITHPQAVRRRIGLVFQDQTLDEQLTADENLRFHAVLYDVPRREVAPRIDRVLGLGLVRHRFATELSTGSRRLVEFGCLLAQEPDVLLLDEPSAGLARAEAEALAPVLCRIRDATGAAMVVVEHDLGLLRSTCDRLIALDTGLELTQGTPDEVLSHPAVVAAYLGGVATTP